MPYISSMERFGQRIGEERGIQIGEAKILTRLLHHRFGTIPDWANKKIAEAEPPSLGGVESSICGCPNRWMKSFLTRHNAWGRRCHFIPVMNGVVKEKYSYYIIMSLFDFFLKKATITKAEFLHMTYFTLPTIMVLLQKSLFDKLRHGLMDDEGSALGCP
ncbi:MAG: hypothetical protein HQL75_08750 [Magnetococcales bacterium]|nr:hypothetical protein [Magnetococcales bacterium]